MEALWEISAALRRRLYTRIAQNRVAFDKFSSLLELAPLSATISVISTASTYGLPYADGKQNVVTCERFEAGIRKSLVK